MTKVKICGLMDKETVDATCRFGADYIGFVFAPSKREVSAELVRQITKDVPATIKKVGVFVSPTIQQLQQTIAIAHLDFVQIHGDFPTERVDIPMIQAKSVTNTQNYQTIADFLLLDAPPKEYHGGNGVMFDWQAVNLNQLPQIPYFVAGGLRPENVQQALRYFQPFAVDVSSGVETDGQKDLKKIEQFINQVKEYDYVSTTR
uniref:phosphoribosylanthranilate isomerase n=1 Tax=Candidatus Enterococcus willemsii TaxID=1857215 RepID=UPI00403FA969